MREQTLWFLAPGLVHQLGNVLFAMQGHVQLANAGPDSEHLLAAIRRAGDGVGLVRALLGEGGAGRAPGALLPTFLELLRVPLRDAGLHVELHGQAPCVTLAPESLVVALGATLRHLRQVLGGLPGTVQLEPGPGADGRLTLTVRLVHHAGDLPFSFDAEAASRVLRDELAEVGVGVLPCGDGSGLTLDLPASAPEAPA